VAVLLDKEAMGRRVEAAAQGLNSKLPRESLSRSGKIIDTYDCAKASEIDKILSESSSLKERVSAMAEQAQALRVQMEEYKSSIKAQRAAVQQRRSDAESATYGRVARETKEFESLEASIRRIRRRWEMKHNEIVDGRAALCSPAARLAGFRRHRRRREDVSVREYYTIGSGIPIFDLRELHGRSATCLALPAVLTSNSGKAR
jgi:vacuolar-type H+-ATPase subunit I/STV1